MKNNKIYRYGDKYYSIEELYEIYNKIHFDNKKAFKDCLCHYILSEIFKKAGINSNDILSIANIEYKYINGNLSKINKFINDEKYSLLIKKIFGLKSVIKKYKVSEFINGEWILNKLISQTLGSGVKKDIIDNLELIDYTTLTEEECLEITKNFRRNINDEEIIFIKNPKTLRK